jgi:conjugal transfer mating pair stabilization protein TraG
MANWLKGGFEMDRHGNWRLKPQVADTLQRNVQAIMAQTGWQRSVARSAQDQATVGTSVDANIGGAHESASRDVSGKAGSQGGISTASSGRIGGSVGYKSSELGVEAETAHSNLDIVNYDVRGAIRAAEGAAARTDNPEQAFSEELSRQIAGPDGLRSRYLEDARAGRGTTDVTGPITSIDQRSILSTGRFQLDLDNSPEDGPR